MPLLIPAMLTSPFEQAYPTMRLSPHVGYRSLMEQPVLMLVALTGTGKSTSLAALQQVASGAYQSAIPSRRELADLIVLPMAQSLLGEKSTSTLDRVQRFAYTRYFAEQITGSFAAVYASLYLQSESALPIISEGIRGANEIDFVLEHCPNWRVVELWLDPLTRLKRLSNRDDAFDQAALHSDISFLPIGLQKSARIALEAGEISPKALAIIKAEAENYGFAPYAKRHSRYHLIHVDRLSPQETAEQVLLILKAMTHAQN